VEYVRTYDPETSFIMFDATVDLDRALMTDVEIDVVPFLTGTTVSNA
jgi:hypothetical protein